jgi:hypothetical protein
LTVVVRVPAVPEVTVLTVLYALAPLALNWRATGRPVYPEYLAVSQSARVSAPLTVRVLPFFTGSGVASVPGKFFATGRERTG